LKYDNNDIVIVIDNLLNIWFYGAQISKILEYKDTNAAIRLKVNTINKTMYENIKEYSKYKYNVQDHAIFINEAGLYELTLKSKMKKAEKFQGWITSEVIPTLRKQGIYEMNEKEKEDLIKMNENINEYKQRIMILENNQAKPKYPKGGYVYAIKPPDLSQKDNKLYKPGKTENLSKRLNTYNTAYSDKVILVHKIKVDDPSAVEHCIKAFLSKYVYIKNKEFYKIDRESLINIMDTCAKMMNCDLTKPDKSCNVINKINKKDHMKKKMIYLESYQ
jgi:prophage antirepressor-like protein